MWQSEQDSQKCRIARISYQKEKYLNSREATLAVTVTRSPGMTNTCSRHYRRLDIRRRVKAVLGKLSGAALVHR